MEGATQEEQCDWVWVPIMETVCEANDDGNPNDENLNEIECKLKEVGEYQDWVCEWVDVPDPDPNPSGDCDEEDQPCDEGGGEEPEGPEPEPDPCDEVGTQITNTNYKAKVAELKTKTNLKYESGYEETKNGTYTPLVNAGSDALTAVPTTDTKGFPHNHVEPYETGKLNEDGVPIIHKPIKMFSPADVNTLMNLANINRSSGDFSPYYVSMVTNNQHYIIKFTGSANDIQTGFGGEVWKDRYREHMSKFYNLEKGFLQFLKNEMSVNGVELYKVKNNGAVKSIALKPDGKSTIEKDC